MGLGHREPWIKEFKLTLVMGYHFEESSNTGKRRNIMEISSWMTDRMVGPMTELQKSRIVDCTRGWQRG